MEQLLICNLDERERREKRERVVSECIVLLVGWTPVHLAPGLKSRVFGVVGAWNAPHA